jgi:predicted anti-sigma-YlaC factor YlaD
MVKVFCNHCQKEINLNKLELTQEEIDQFTVKELNEHLQYCDHCESILLEEKELKNKGINSTADFLNYVMK